MTIALKMISKDFPTLACCNTLPNVCMYGRSSSQFIDSMSALEKLGSIYTEIRTLRWYDSETTKKFKVLRAVRQRNLCTYTNGRLPMTITSEKRRPSSHDQNRDILSHSNSRGDNSEVECLALTLALEGSVREPMNATYRLVRYHLSPVHSRLDNELSPVSVERLKTALRSSGTRPGQDAETARREEQLAGARDNAPDKNKMRAV